MPQGCAWELVIILVGLGIAAGWFAGSWTSDAAAERIIGSLIKAFGELNKPKREPWEEDPDGWKQGGE